MGKIMDMLRRWKINRMTGRGVVLLKLGKYESALKLLLKTIELDPGNQMAWTAKGLTFAKLHRHREAIQAYNKALTLNPSDEERKQINTLLKRTRERE
ncbi:MAG TPA: tetratricopeptide repeat protein [Desulfobacteraceae bacterium]|nr:tetratricopeptide repeat protein [Desulfobacteraceae bacterium]HPJ67239.1 tetratricopeptide repeat protein [Desulfobacteraceae bacterium]HPQ27381.1 tetratricopeptide repeat protein [Desulfobacteraceae bacterium]